MPFKNKTRRNEWMRRHRARKLYAIDDPENHPLRRWRKANGLSKAAAARILGTSPTSINNYEVGINPTPDWVVECIAPENAEYMSKKIEAEKVVHISPQDSELRIWRKTRRMSKAEVGFVVGRTGKTVEKWERGVRKTPDWAWKRLEEYDARLNKEKDLRDRRMAVLFPDAGPRGGL